MYISKFIVEQDYQGEKLLFSTLTTATITLPQKTYNTIFLEENFDQEPAVVKQLLEMGFIHDSSFNEDAALEELRKQTYAKNNQNTLYYMITPTLACNARCYYCFEKNVHHQTMSEETAIKVSDFIIKNNNQETLLLQWFGGEPLLAPHIIDLICARLRAANVTFNSKLTTNGYLLNDDILRKATTDWNIKTVQITVDGLEDEYNKIKNYVYKTEESPFKRVISNIHSALGYGIFIRIRVNVNFKNLKQAQDVISFLKTEFGKYSNCYVYFAPINETEDISPAISGDFANTSKHPLLTMLDFENGFAALGQSRLSLVEKPTTWDDILLKYFIHPIPVSCFGTCKCSLSIDSKGDIYVCHRLFGKGENYCSGNVESGLIKNSICLEYQSPRPPENCSCCNLLPICQGGCHYNRQTYGENQACVLSKGAVKQLIIRAIEELKEIQKSKTK